MKKILAVLLAAVLVLALAACGGNTSDEAKDFKAGFIFLHDENSTYDLNFMNAAKEACEALGLEQGTGYIIKTNIPEGLRRNSPTCNSPMRPAPVPTPKTCPTMPTRSLPSMKAVTLPALPQVSS